MARMLTLTVALTLALTGPASAGMTWEFAELVARDHWQARGAALPCEPTPRLLTEAEDREWQARYIAEYGAEFDMAADLAGCRVIITPLPEHWRQDGLGWLYCREVVHEIGHLAGFTHEHGGAMADETPFGCAHPRQWAVQQGWRKPPRWVRRSPARIERLWLSGRVWRAQVARARWLGR